MLAPDPVVPDQFHLAESKVIKGSYIVIRVPGLGVGVGLNVGVGLGVNGGVTGIGVGVTGEVIGAVIGNAPYAREAVRVNNGIIIVENKIA